MAHTIVHFEIPADNPERAAKFYRELFGWDIQRFQGSGEGTEDRDSDFEYWMVKTVPTDGSGRPSEQGVNGGLMRRMFPNQTPINYISVESVDDFLGKAQQLGAKVMMGKRPVPAMGWFAQLTDPEGNPFAIWETDSSAGLPAGAQSQEAGNARR